MFLTFVHIYTVYILAVFEQVKFCIKHESIIVHICSQNKFVIVFCTFVLCCCPDMYYSQTILMCSSFEKIDCLSVG